VANVTFVFGTSPNTKPEEKKWGDIADYVPHLKKWGGHVPRVPHQIAPMMPLTKYLYKRMSAKDGSE